MTCGLGALEHNVGPDEDVKDLRGEIVITWIVWIGLDKCVLFGHSLSPTLGDYLFELDHISDCEEP